MVAGAACARCRRAADGHPRATCARWPPARCSRWRAWPGSRSTTSWPARRSRGDVAVGVVRRRTGWAARWSTGSSSRCSAGSTPGTPTSSRWTPTVPQLAGAVRVRAVAAARGRPRSAESPSRRRSPSCRCSPAVRGGVGRLPAAVAQACRRAGAVVPGRRHGARAAALAGRLAAGRGPARQPEELVRRRGGARGPGRAGGPAAGGRGAGRPPPSCRRSSTPASGWSTLAVPADAVAGRLPGTGFLVPPVEGRTVKAATYSSHKWEWLADDGGRPGRAPGLGRPAPRGRRPAARRRRAGRPGGSPTCPRRCAPRCTRSRRPSRAGAGRCRSTRSGTSSGSRTSGGPSPRHPGLAVCGAAYDGVGRPRVRRVGQGGRRPGHRRTRGAARMGPWLTAAVAVRAGPTASGPASSTT